MPSTRPTRVLIIGYVWPEPRSSAAGGHMMQIIESFLQRGWHVTFSSPAGIGEHKADLAGLEHEGAPVGNLGQGIQISLGHQQFGHCVVVQFDPA